MLRYEARSAADPATAWALLSRPDRWHEWSPHVRGAWGLGEPEVERGAVGAARLLWIVPVPAKVLAVSEGRSWTWSVGAIEFDHRVESDGAGGCIVGTDLRAPAALEAVLKLSYGPWCGLLMKNLARVAAQKRLSPGSASPR